MRSLVSTRRSSPTSAPASPPSRWTCAGSPSESDWLEVDFGGPNDVHPPLERPGGVRLRGRIDRIDTDAAGHALVLDYKGRIAVESARWRTTRAV